MIKHITYADSKMTISASKCVQSALANGADESYYLTNDNLEEEFYRFNEATLKQERGVGYWLWKPYIVYQTMTDLNDGDILIYSDAGVEFVNNVSEIINRMTEDIFFFTNGFLQKEWCKGDIMNKINGWYTYETFDQKQVQASVIFFKVNQRTRDFVKEWLLWCQMPGLIDDSPSRFENCKTFAENRHDQSILTALQIKYGYKLHFWPTNYSEHIRHTAQPEDNYPVIFNHHRKRNNEY
jgi:hypothetical protein